jgi:phage tail-like protein
MAQFTVNPQRLDPYKNFKFRLRWDGRIVAGISRVSPLHRITEVLEFREGGNPSLSHRSPGTTRYEPITLERGVTQDHEFEQWANKVWLVQAGTEVSLKDFRKDVILDLMNEAGQVTIAYKIYRCWVSEYQALPELNANDPQIAIEKIVLQNEGWERDADVAEPLEPSYTIPPS